MDQKSFNPVLESVHEIQTFVNEKLSGHIDDSKKCLKIELMVEEISVNIIRYGLRDQSDGKLNVAVSVHADHATLTFIDNGPAFNPLQTETPDLKADLKTRRPGGLGIFLVRQIANDIHYARENALNRLALKIDLT